eukprot:TRINITY_DN2343_c0_g1_i1.p1 TRINITY_DN2343_c0_g1~~TRINITY_DN2343_c0_g1_i1.p1  ORF type:complete len:500 (+),score=128.30 TRINITY_DN2343_c0_g1_i1:59-1501(+)
MAAARAAGARAAAVAANRRRSGGGGRAADVQSSKMEPVIISRDEFELDELRPPEVAVGGEDAASKEDDGCAAADAAPPPSAASRAVSFVDPQAQAVEQPEAARGRHERRFLLCLDEHDEHADAAVSYASYLVLPSMIDPRHRSTQVRNTVRVFGHVHLNSRVPFAGRLGRLFGASQTREQRGAQLREHCHTVAAALGQHLAQLSCNLEVEVDVDDSERTQAQAYLQYARTHQPQYVLINEREDRFLSSSLFGSESWHLKNALDDFTVIVAKANIEGIDPVQEVQQGEAVGQPEPAQRRSSSSRMRRNTGRRLSPETGRGMQVLLMVDPEVRESSIRAIRCAADLLKPEDRLVVYTAWALPDFATAMYASDTRWHSSLRHTEQLARAQAHKVASQIINVAGLDESQVRVLVEQDDPGKGAAKLVSKGNFHLTICGAKRVEDSDAHGPVFNGWFGHYRRRVFGTTADHMISHSASPAVAVCH